jgi:hypothetical protein
MSLQLYKPNPKNTGCAMSFQISQKPDQEPQFFANCILQHSWNNQNKTGSFSESRNDPSKTIALKFNEFELGEIISSFNNKTAYSTFHSNESTKTQIRLTPYEKTRGSGDFAVQVTAFGFTIIRNGSDTFKIPVDPGEGVRLVAFINHYFNVLDAVRDQKAKDNQKQYQANKQKFTPKKKEAPKQPVAAEEDEF